MKQVFFDILKKKGPYIVIALSMTSAITFFISKYYGTKGHNAQVLKDGIQTCLSRLNQSYTAKISGNTTSSFLQGPFIKATEECFSEVISYSENVFRSLDQEMSGTLHFLSSEAYWLHYKLTGKSKKVFSRPHGGTAVSNSNGEKKFQTIQTKADQVVSSLQFQRSSSSEKSSFLAYITYALLILVICQSLYELFSSRISQKRSAVFENRDNNYDSEMEQTLLCDGLKSSFERLSEKVFTEGIKINLKVNEQCRLPLKREKLIDFLFYSMNSAMGLGSKKITIETKRRGKNEMINILGHGVVFSKEFLEQEKYEENLDVIAPEYTEFYKLKKIVGNSGRISFSNKMGRNSLAIGLSAV